jgi:hypothetical protein
MNTPGPYRVGKPGGSIVSDHPVENGASGHDDVEYYGGYLVAETVAPCNQPLLSAAPDLLTVASAASHALKSYEHGNGSPDLARSCAAALDAAIAKAEGRS